MVDRSADRQIVGATTNLMSDNFDGLGSRAVDVDELEVENLRGLSRMDGQFIKFDYDPRNRAIKAYDRQSRTIDYTYDLAGRLVQVKTEKSARRYAYVGTYLSSIDQDDQRLFQLRYTRGRIGERL